jgi:hypothetical protein
MEAGQLVSLFDFENREKLFPAVDSRMKFCLLTLAGERMANGEAADGEGRMANGRMADGESSPATFAFFATRAEHLRDPRRVFGLTAAEIARINPNTRTLPVFRTRQDAALTSAIYARVPVLVNEGVAGGEAAGGEEVDGEWRMVDGSPSPPHLPHSPPHSLFAIPHSPTPTRGACASCACSTCRTTLTSSARAPSWRRRDIGWSGTPTSRATRLRRPPSATCPSTRPR